MTQYPKRIDIRVSGTTYVFNVANIPATVWREIAIFGLRNMLRNACVGEADTALHKSLMQQRLTKLQQRGS